MDATWTFLQAHTAVFKGLPPAKEAEAIGLLEAIKWLKEQNFEDVII